MRVVGLDSKDWDPSVLAACKERITTARWSSVSLALQGPTRRKMVSSPVIFAQEVMLTGQLEQQI